MHHNHLAPRPRMRWAALPLIVLLATACGGSGDAASGSDGAPGASAEEAAGPTGGPDALVGSWSLVRIVRDEGDALDPPEDAVPTIDFTAEANPTGSRLYSGSAGCNRISGAYDAGSTGRLGIAAGAAMTMMACPDPVMRIEQAFMGALESSDTYTVDGNELVIEFDGGSLLMERGGA